MASVLIYQAATGSPRFVDETDVNAVLAETDGSGRPLYTKDDPVTPEERARRKEASLERIAARVASQQGIDIDEARAVVAADVNRRKARS